MWDFINLCKLSQTDLKSHLADKLLEHFPVENITSGDGYLYAEGTIPILLVAHLDTVHKELPRTILYDEESKIISSPEGIGGDDRSGVYILLEVLKEHNCSVLFCEDEEAGAVGAEKFTQTKLAESLGFHFIIEFDRKGANDAVFYDCDNPDFESFITREYFKTNWGTFSDISILAPYFGCAAVNLSCGYYNPHTVNEYVVFPEMQRIIAETCKLLNRTTESDAFEYIEAEKSDWYGFYSDYFPVKHSNKGSVYWITYSDANGNTQWYDTHAISEMEAIGIFTVDTDLPYSAIINIYEDR